jgi:hypothetical protein
MKLVGSHGNLSLLFMMKVMVKSTHQLCVGSIMMFSLNKIRGNMMFDLNEMWGTISYNMD